MRWLLICLLVSLVALLFAAAAMAHHILMQRRQLRRGARSGADPVVDSIEETEVKPEV
jgi:hypothetical protein